jgi:hypothetical protein
LGRTNQVAEVGGACGTHGRDKTIQGFGGKARKERAHSEDRGMDGIRWGGGGGEVDSVGSGQGPVAGSCENGDEPSGSGATDLVINKTEICFSVFTIQINIHC